MVKETVSLAPFIRLTVGGVSESQAAGTPGAPDPGPPAIVPVVINEVLTRSDLLNALAQQGPDAPVDRVMQRDFQIADANEMLEPAFARLQSCDCHTMPVTSRGQLVGLLTADNIGEFLMIQAAMGAARERSYSPQRFGA